jgi:hypothetical protein
MHLFLKVEALTIILETNSSTLSEIIMLKLLVFATILTTLLSCERNTPLIKYEPKSSQEQALKSVLLHFQEAVTNKDSNEVLSLIHEKASIMIGTDQKLLSKMKYAEILPERLADNSYIALGKPQITVSGDTAEIKIYMTRADNNFLMTFIMKLEYNTWYIFSWEY